MFALYYFGQLHELWLHSLEHRAIWVVSQHQQRFFVLDVGKNGVVYVAALEILDVTHAFKVVLSMG